MTTKHKAVTARGGRKLTLKQEAFCLAYVETGNASEAYRSSYDASRMKTETVNNKAHQMLQKGEIRARVSELQEVHVERHKLTVDDLLKELEDARQAALTAETPQSSAAVAATMGKAKLLGLDKQILEHTGPDGMPIVVAPTVIELVAPNVDSKD